MSHVIKTATLLAIIVCVFACKENGYYEGKRSEDAFREMTALYDSMLHKSPKALSQIRRRLQTTTDSLTWYDYYIMYGRHYLLTESPDSTLPYVERVLHYTGSQKPTPRINGLTASALTAKAAYMYLLHHSPDSVIALYRRAYLLMMNSDLQQHVSDLSANLGDAYVSIGDLPNASKWYRRALFLNDSLKLPKRQTLSLYMGLGRIYTILHDYEQAEAFYKMTEKRIDELQPNLQSYFLNNYGNYFYFRKEYDRALQVFRRLRAHITRYDCEQNFDRYLCDINMADVFLNLGETDSARYYISAPEQYFREHKVDVGTYYAQTIRIGIALKEKRYAEVERIIGEAKGMEVSDIDMRRIRKDYLNQYYAAIGDYQRAYQELSRSMVLADSSEFNLLNMRSADILTRLTEDTIRLHSQIRINEQEVKYVKSRTLFWMITSLLTATILLVVLFFIYQRKRYLQTRLDMLTQRLQNARQRISPHFIFNVLNSRISQADKGEREQLIKLAKLIRINLDLTRKTIVTLDEELDFVRQYVDIERQVSGLDFDLRIETPGSELLKSTRLPSMLVQILTENAILHGLKNKEGEKMLCIKVEDLGTEVRISVIDNGPGFDIRRYNSERARTGLNIIRSTVSAVNLENNKKRLRFNIYNDHGCHAVLTLSKNIKYIFA